MKFRVQGMGLVVYGLRVPGLGFDVWGFRIQGLGFRGFGCRVTGLGLTVNFAVLPRKLVVVPTKFRVTRIPRS